MKSGLPSTFPAPSEGSRAEPSTQAPADLASRAPPATLDLALLRGALEEIPFGVATTRGGVILYANDGLARIYGTPQGGLEGKHVSQLFPEAYPRMEPRLEEARVFDGRVHTVGFDGRPIDAEVHVEWYSSEAQGVGGFLVVRDVTHELGALGRLVDQLGAALFRIRVEDGALDLASPGIARLTGLDAATCLQHPVLLTALVSAEERERVLFLYRRLTRGEVGVANAQVSIKRPDGSRRVLQLRATGRRDTAGVVRHVDGVLSDPLREAEAHAPPRQPEPGPSRDPLASASMVLTHELLREGSQQLHSIQRELRGLRAALRAHADRLPEDIAGDLTARLEAVASAQAGAAALTRGVRRVLAGATTLGAPLGELLEGVAATLGPVMAPQIDGTPGRGHDAGPLLIDAGDAANAIVPERVQELGAALVYLSLRAYRFAGSGSLRIMAHRASFPFEPQRQRARTSSRPPAEREHLMIEIVGSAPADMADTSIEISSEMVNTVPRPAEADLAYHAAQTLVAAAGGAIESDDASFSSARTVIRLRV